MAISIEQGAAVMRHFQKHIRLTEADMALLCRFFTLKTYKNKQFLLQEGEICQHSFFVLEGCLKSYSIDKNGFEHILNFAAPDWWMADMYSLISQKPAVLNIQCLLPTTALLLAKTDQEKLYEYVPNIERFFRIITENSLVAYQQRIIENLSFNAEERYQAFCKKYPSLINNLPQKEIAAYIGVTPEFFSKMRKQLLRQSSPPQYKP